MKNTKDNTISEQSRLARFEDSRRELEQAEENEFPMDDEYEFALSSMTEEELDQMANDMQAEETQRDENDEFGFSRDADDAYDLDR